MKDEGQKMRSGLGPAVRHAFAVDAEAHWEPTERQRQVVARLCAEVRRRRMVVPAVMVLEMGRPLNFLASQAMHFFHPFLTAIVDRNGYEEFASFLARRGSVDYLCRQLEQPEADDR